MAVPSAMYGFTMSIIIALKLLYLSALGVINAVLGHCVRINPTRTGSLAKVVLSSARTPVILYQSLNQLLVVSRSHYEN